MLHNHDIAPPESTLPLFELVLENPEKLSLFYLKPQLQITYEPLPTGRICGVVRGSRAVIEQVLSDLDNNQLVGSRDLLEAIRKTRTAIFTAKSQLVKPRLPR